MEQIRILVFPCGSEIGLEIHKSLKDIPFITLIGASSAPDHGKFVYANYYEELPYITDANFFSSFENLLKTEKIDYVFPAMDSVMAFLSGRREELSAPLLTSSHEAVMICQSKQSTYDALAGLSFLPQIYSDIGSIKDYPVIIKPSVGYGSRGFKIIESKQQLEYELSSRTEPQVICEYLSGREFTIDCFTDRHGALRFSSCRTRDRVRNGISVSSSLEREYAEEIQEISVQINKRIPMRGAWFFQLKQRQDGTLKLLEVATRIAGTMCVQRAVGINLPLLTVFDAMGYHVALSQQFETAVVDRALYNNFKLPLAYDELYIDFDDTLIVRGRVNLSAIQLLYQCVNKQIPVYLITKHTGDIHASLAKHKISTELFDKIIHLGEKDKKCELIKPSPRALFLDDAFSERKQMQDAWGITALGVDSIECLLDWRQ